MTREKQKNCRIIVFHIFYIFAEKFSNNTTICWSFYRILCSTKCLLLFVNIFLDIFKAFMVVSSFLKIPIRADSSSVLISNFSQCKYDPGKVAF